MSARHSLDGRPQSRTDHSSIRRELRGRWEGETLVVEDRQSQTASDQAVEPPENSLSRGDLSDAPPRGRTVHPSQS